MDDFQTLWPIWRTVFHSKTIVVDPLHTLLWAFRRIRLSAWKSQILFYILNNIILQTTDKFASSSPHPSPHKLRSIVKLEGKKCIEPLFFRLRSGNERQPQNERRGKKVEKNVSVEKIGLGGSYATHCKNDLFNAVFGGCTLPACMCLFKGSTPNTIWKQEIRMIGSERKSESYSCLNASNLILVSQCLKLDSQLSKLDSKMESKCLKNIFLKSFENFRQKSLSQ